MEKVKKSIKHSELISKLHHLVDEAIKEESLIIYNLENPPEELLTEGQRLSDNVARFGGSWNFIIYFAVFLSLWIIYNMITKTPFDPYPFILMNLILSCIAALQAPIIMMSQNRKEEKDRKRAENDYLINLKSEIEIRNLHQKIDLLMEEQILSLMESQKEMMKCLKDLKQKEGK